MLLALQYHHTAQGYPPPFIHPKAQEGIHRGLISESCWIQTLAASRGQDGARGRNTESEEPRGMSFLEGEVGSESLKDKHVFILLRRHLL